MARKPNYKFERVERDRAKAAKKAARLEAKREKAEERKADKVEEESANSFAEPVGEENSGG